MCHDDLVQRRAVARRSFRRLPQFLIAIALLTSVGSPSAAIERRPLPAFRITAVDGAEVDSAQIVQTGRWLLVYVRDDCRPCNELLHLVHTVNDVKEERQALATRMVIVVGGADSARLAAFRSTFPDLGHATWFGDPRRQLPSILGLPGAPVIIGLSDRTLVWSRAGMLKTSAETRAVLESWVNKP